VDFYTIKHEECLKYIIPVIRVYFLIGHGNPFCYSRGKLLDCSDIQDFPVL
jgi:hypothetical protein